MVPAARPPMVPAARLPKTPPAVPPARQPRLTPDQYINRDRAAEAREAEAGRVEAERVEAERLAAATAAEDARYEIERVEKERERAAAEQAARAEAERQAAETFAKAKEAEAAREDSARPESIMCEAEIKAPINSGRDTTAMAPAGTAQKGWKERLKRQPKGSWTGQDESQFYANLPVLITALVDRDVQESATTLPLTKGESVAVIRTDYCPAGQWVVRLGSGATGLVDTASLQMTADVLSRRRCTWGQQNPAARRPGRTRAPCAPSPTTTITRTTRTTSATATQKTRRRSSRSATTACPRPTTSGTRSSGKWTSTATRAGAWRDGDAGAALHSSAHAPV